MIFGKKGSVMERLGKEHSISGAMDAKWYLDQWKKDPNLYKKYNGDYFAYIKDVKKQVSQKMLMGSTISGQIKALDAYIDTLSKSTRFKNVKGALYDPNTGWNVGYRVTSADLMSPIPLKPFEAIHSKADVPFGKPAKEEVDSIGVMPFTWMQNGAKIAVHPVNYEMERAKALRKLYAWVAEQAGNTMFKTDFFGNNQSMANFNKVIQDKGGKAWLEWNNAVSKKSLFKYENPESVLYGDKFGSYIKKLRAGKLQGRENSLDSAVNGDKKHGATISPEMKSTARDAAVMGTLSTMGPIGIASAIGYKAAAIAGDWQAKKDAIAKKYDKAQNGLDGELATKKGDGFLTRIKKWNARRKRRNSAVDTIEEWRGTEASGVNYGKVRDFWLDSGALDLFKNHTIFGTTGAAIPLIDFLIKKDMLPKAPKADKSNRIHDLMHWFYGKAGIKGYDWKQVVGDEESQAGFA